MSLFSRRWVPAAFLTVFALGCWGVTLLPGAPLVPVLTGLAWLGAAIVGARRWLPEVTIRTPDLEVPVQFVPSDPVEPIAPEMGEEPSAEPPVLPEVPQATPEPEPEPESRVVDWSPVVALVEALEASWSMPDPVTSRLKELSDNATFIRENVQRSFEIADNLAGGAQRAFALSEKVQKGVVVVTDALVESLRQTEILSGHSERITRILELMGEVSDKIHVLSINASIVSARAGAAGRGFEVVAKEIRSLAKDTEHSLGDIVEVIELLRSSIAKVIQVVRDADLETQQEKNSLIEVAGALQGVLLGVEIVKAVSNFAKDKADEQDQLVRSLITAGNDPSPLKWKAEAVKAHLEEWNLKE